VWLSHRFGSVANSEMVRNTMGFFPSKIRIRQ
jgi:hypothetical protein